MPVVTKYVFFSVCLGIGFFIASLLWRVWILIEFGPEAASSRSLVPALTLPIEGDWVRVLMAGVVSPAIETAGFILILAGLLAIQRFLPSGGLAPLYLIICGVTGWYLHGANLATLGQATCFAVLATFTVTVYSRFGLSTAAGLNLLTHIVWNAGGVAIFIWAKLR